MPASLRMAYHRRGEGFAATIGGFDMLGLQSKRGVRTWNGVTRREFLRAGGLAIGLSLADQAQLQQAGAAPSTNDKACIQLILTGGPSQLETWDPKPDAPESIRGPFRAIQTNVPGIRISEHFPRMAKQADRYVIVRSVYHKEAPIHESGQQLLQTGRFSSGGDGPHAGAVVNYLQPAESAPTWIVLPALLEDSGARTGNGQGSGFLGKAHGPVVLGKEVFDGHLKAEPANRRARYGWNTFGQSCLLARRLVQQGVRLVTVNMFDSVFGKVTWDCHANGSDLNSTLDDYRTTLCPMFDLAYTTLLDDLAETGFLEKTLVVAMGEFGRSPRLNGAGGRDHWPGVWSVLMAGGGVRGGQVIGSSDTHAEAPRDRPVHASQIATTVYHALGIDSTARLCADGRPFPVIEAEPVFELF